MRGGFSATRCWNANSGHTLTLLYAYATLLKTVGTLPRRTTRLLLRSLELPCRPERREGPHCASHQVNGAMRSFAPLRMTRNDVTCAVPGRAELELAPILLL